MTDLKSRYETLTALADEYRRLAAENYARTRSLAEAIRGGFCGYLNSNDPPCVLLVPPYGPFEPRSYGDLAFSAPPTGLQPLGPILFGLAVRVSDKNDWLRLVLECVKEGETFTVDIQGGGEHRFRMPLHGQDPVEFFGALYDHVETFFKNAISDYQVGTYGQRDMGFDFSAQMPADAAAPTERD